MRDSPLYLDLMCSTLAELKCSIAQRAHTNYSIAYDVVNCGGGGGGVGVGAGGGMLHGLCVPYIQFIHMLFC